MGRVEVGLVSRRGRQAGRAAIVAASASFRASWRSRVVTLPYPELASLAVIKYQKFIVMMKR
jgi:hypothetical protein